MTVTLSLFAGVGAQFLDNNGNILSGGKIYTYNAGTTTPLATYTTNLGNVAQPNPIILDSSGRIPTGELWLSNGFGYKFVTKDSTDVLIGTYDNVPSSAQPPIVNDASSVYYEQGNVEIAGSFEIGQTYLITSLGNTNFQLIGASANQVGIHFIATGVGSGTGTAQFSRSIQAKLQEWVSVKDFGALGDGTTDDTTAIQNAINAVIQGGSVYIPATTNGYRITNKLILPSYINIYGDGKDSLGSKIIKDFGDYFAFYGITKTYISIKNLSIIANALQPTLSNPNGGIGLQSCTNCEIDNIYVSGVCGSGVWLYDSSNSTISNCKMESWNISTYHQDAADISIYSNSNSNLITNNICLGGGDHGIIIQDPYSGSSPTGNKVIANKVGPHQAYGITVYVTHSYDTKTIVANNEVYGILGTSLSGNSGMGIYMQSASGIVTGNQVYNCCLSTTSFFTLGGAAISAATSYKYPIIISNNNVYAERGNCIGVYTSLGPVNIIGNTCTQNSTDASLNPTAIYVSNAQNVIVSNNIVNATTPQWGIQAVARDATIVKGLKIIGNNVTATTYGIGVGIIDTSTFIDVIISNNYVSGSSSYGLNIQKVTNLNISSNIVHCDTQVFNVLNCPNTTMTGNIFISADTVNNSIYFLGVCTGSIGDESNKLTGLVFQDTGVNFIISQYGSTAPVTGSHWDAGARVIQSIPVVGNPTGWRCTTAGYPGTWVAEANL